MAAVTWHHQGLGFCFCFVIPPVFLHLLIAPFVFKTDVGAKTDVRALWDGGIHFYWYKHILWGISTFEKPIPFWLLSPTEVLCCIFVSQTWCKVLTNNFCERSVSAVQICKEVTCWKSSSLIPDTWGQAVNVPWWIILIILSICIITFEHANGLSCVVLM